MRPARIITAVIFAAAIAVTGWSVHSGAAQPSGPRTAPNPTLVDRTQVDRQALIYGAVLRQYLTSGDAAIAADYRFSHIFVIDHAVASAGAAGPGTAGDGPIPPAARRAITHALTDVGPLSFVASGDEVIEPHSCANVRGDGILITLGPVEGTGDRAQVSVNGHMSCLGGNSLTYEIRQTGSGWRVSGITAMGPVA
jgi:hypothetical protein